MAEDEPLISSGQVAKKLGVTQSAVTNWVAQGWITPAEITAGGQYRFRISEVREQLRKRRQGDVDQA